MQILKKLIVFTVFLSVSNSFSQDYFFEDKNPFDSKISIEWPLECQEISEKDRSTVMINDKFCGVPVK